MSSHGKFKRLAFIFNWKIENFSHCIEKKGEYLNSPSFVADTLSNTKWYLQLFPRGQDEENKIELRLYKEESDSGPKRITIDFELSIISNTTLTILNGWRRRKKILFISGHNLGHIFGVTKEESKITNQSHFLANDSLEVSCRMWWTSKNINTIGKSLAITCVKVARRCFTWDVENIHQHNSTWNTSFDIALDPKISLNLKLIKLGLSASVQNFQVEVVQIPVEDNLVTSRMEILDDAGETIASIEGQRWFKQQTSKHVWRLPKFKRSCDIPSDQELYSLDGKLSIRCEYTYSDGSTFDQMECSTYDLKTMNDEFHVIQPQLLPDRVQPLKPSVASSDCSSTLLVDIKNLFIDKTFSDVTLCIGNRKFQVHKSILGARSTVFRAMLNNDMIESRTGEVHISDIDSTTVDRLLLFVYTDTVKDLDFESATKLFVAADKYAIQPLREICLSFLKSNLSTSNACTALALADLHQDEDLKFVVEKFMVAHGKEILASEEWKQFESDNIVLAVKTMRQIFVNSKMEPLF